MTTTCGTNITVGRQTWTNMQGGEVMWEGARPSLHPSHDPSLLHSRRPLGSAECAHGVVERRRCVMQRGKPGSMHIDIIIEGAC